MVPSRAPSRRPSVATSALQAAFPLGAEAGAVLSQPARMSVGSRGSQRTLRSKGSCPVEIVGEVINMAQQQHADAIQREHLYLQREAAMIQIAAKEKEDLRVEAAQEKQNLRAEAARRENLIAEEKQNLRAEALQREQAIRDDVRNRDKLFFDSNDRDKERAMKEIQRREDLARKMALEEAEKRMILMQQLADEKVVQKLKNCIRSTSVKRDTKCRKKSNELNRKKPRKKSMRELKRLP